MAPVLDKPHDEHDHAGQGRHQGHHLANEVCDGIQGNQHKVCVAERQQRPREDNNHLQ
jgi:hypothetical protein